MSRKLFFCFVCQDFLVQFNFWIIKEIKLKDFIRKYIKEMLKYKELGGKTAVEYGYFDI